MVNIGSSIESTVKNQFNNAVGQVTGSLADHVVNEARNGLSQLGLPFPKFALAGIIAGQLLANLFGVKKMDTRLKLAKWAGGLGLIMDVAVGRAKPAIPQQIASPEQQRLQQSNQFAQKAKQGGFLNAAQYSKINIPVIAMSAEYDYLFGMPSRDFYMVIHGLPGNGKTSFAVKFAQYFNKHHGRVLYLASEQNGIDLSLQDILKNNKANFQIHTQPRQLSEADLLTAFNSYDLIVLDSATNMGFYPVDVKKLQEQSGKAMIAILQSTKDGSFKGSQEWLHDVDVSIKVDEFQAHLEKTRYKTATKKIPTKGTSIPI